MQGEVVAEIVGGAQPAALADVVDGQVGGLQQDLRAGETLMEQPLHRAHAG
jgi:hypothetical protein